MNQSTSNEWFAEWFNQDYLALYAHRSTREARTVVDLIESRIPALGRGRTLDLGCGAGRHLRPLARLQPVVGLDLSPWLLAAARGNAIDAPLVRADMRTIPFESGAFTLVVSLFTSFGYFEEDSENRHVLSEIARVTRPGGWIVLDFLNASRTRRAIVPLERTQIGGQWVEQARKISESGRFVRKRIRMLGSGREFQECVRLFEAAELSAMLAAAGFEVAEILGDYGGGPWTPDSPRAIALARRTVARYC
jgi:SAM-dependent methyltransferase